MCLSARWEDCMENAASYTLLGEKIMTNIDENLLKQAEAGDSSAQYRVAAAYLINYDAKSSLKWAELSAAQKNADGLCILGVLKLICDDKKAAMQLFEESAELGSAKALQNLADEYLHTYRDEEKALAYYEKTLNHKNCPDDYKIWVEYKIKGIKLWQLAKKKISYEDEIPVFSKRKSEKILYGINFIDDEILFFESLDSSREGGIGFIHSYDKIVFIDEFETYKRVLSGEIKISEINKKPLYKLFGIYKFLDNEFSRNL